jgi:hypothetical protein
MGIAIQMSLKKPKASAPDLLAICGAVLAMNALEKRSIYSGRGHGF